MIYSGVKRVKGLGFRVLGFSKSKKCDCVRCVEDVLLSLSGLHVSLNSRNMQASHDARAKLC